MDIEALKEAVFVAKDLKRRCEEIGLSLPQGNDKKTLASAHTYAEVIVQRLGSLLERVN